MFNSSGPGLDSRLATLLAFASSARLFLSAISSGGTIVVRVGGGLSPTSLPAVFTTVLASPALIPGFGVVRSTTTPLS